MPAQPLTPAQLADATRLKAFYEKWKASRRAVGERASQEVAAAILGFQSQSSVSQYMNGNIPLNVPALIKFSELFDCQPSDISGDLAKEIAKIAEATETVPEADHVPIKMVDAKASAGKGHLVLSNDVSKILMFRRDYLAKNDATHGDVLAFEVTGDSMVDLHIIDGSVVLANRRKTEAVANRVYVLWIKGELCVKELVSMGGAWFARSHNKAKPAEFPDIRLRRDDMIEGRAFWCGFGL